MSTIFRCDICGKVFDDKNHLTYEKNIEKRVKPGDPRSPSEAHRVKTEIKFKIKRWDNNIWKEADVCSECMVSIITQENK